MTTASKRSAKCRLPIRASNVEPPETNHASRKRVTRQAHLITMLQKSGGLSVTSLNTAMRWLPHTTRAALTKLRNKGYIVSKTKVDGVNHYSIVTETLG